MARHRPPSLSRKQVLGNPVKPAKPYRITLSFPISFIPWETRRSVDECTIGAAGAQILDLDDGGCVDDTGAEQTNCTNVSPAVNPFANNAGAGEFFVLLYDIKNDLVAYLAPRSGVPIGGGTLQDAINFDNAHANLEMPYFGQEIFLAAQALNTAAPNLCQPALFTPTTPDCTATGGTTHNDALKLDQQLGANIDATLSTYHLDALLAPTDSPAWTTDLYLATTSCLPALDLPGRQDIQSSTYRRRRYLA